MTGGVGFSSDSKKNLENNERLRNKSRRAFSGRGLKYWPKISPNYNAIHVFRRVMRRKRRRQHFIILGIMFLFTVVALYLLV